MNFLKDDATVHCFEDVVNKSNPFYENDRRQLNTTNNVRACTTLYNYLAEYDDPRIGDFYEPTAEYLEKKDEGQEDEKNKYKAIPYGNRTSSTYSISKTSRAVIGATDPVYYMSAAEAEYLLGGMLCTVRRQRYAKTHYDDAVELSFARWNHDNEIDEFIAVGKPYEFQDADEESMLKCILTQKWIASTRCQAWDAWFDINRTGIPEVSEKTTDDATYVLGTLAYNPNSSLTKGQFAHRFIYSKESLDYNTNAPTKVPAITEPLWWHKK